MPSRSSSSTQGPGALMPIATPPASRTARSCASTRKRRLMSTVVRCATVNGRSPARPDPTRCDATAVDVVLRDDGFWIAFVAAAIVAALSLPLARAKVRLSFATVAIPAACLALAVDYHLEARLVIGMLAVAGAGMVRERVDGCLVPAGLVAIGAAFVVSAPVGIPGWMRVVGFATVVVGVPCAWVLDRRAARLVPFLAVITALGVYVCVPDTEFPLVVLGAVLPAALLALDPGATASPSTGAFVALVVESVL